MSGRQITRGRPPIVPLAIAAALLAGCSSAGGGRPDDRGADAGGAPGCATHHDCPQTEYCYEGQCLRDPQLAVYHCGKKDPAGHDSCPPGRWCVTADATRARCGESASYRCEDACDCGPAHCCVEVAALGGKRCVKDPTDPFLPGGEPLGGACRPGTDPTYCADAPACHAAQRAFSRAGRAGEFSAWRRADDDAPAGPTSTCGAERCFGTSCQCEAGATCLDLFASTPTPDRSCALLAGGSCVSHAVAEAVFGVDPRELLPCCARLTGAGGGCLPGQRCEVGWSADPRYAYRRVTTRCDACGDGSCDEGEYPATCPEDCRCGDGRCAPEEIDACPEDCGFCGDGTCGPDEADSPPFYGGCGECDCGSGTCDRDETPERCPQDCSCGDGVCSPGELCPDDCVCEASPHLPFDARVCGDGYCDDELRVSCTDRETCLSCPSDCGGCRYRVTARHHATSGLAAQDLASLNAVWGEAGGELLAAGEIGQILRFDGERWTRATPALHKWRIRGIWGRSAAEVYAVGEGTGATPDAMRFDGHQLTALATPDEASLEAVWGGATGAVRAVGAKGTILRLTAAGFVDEPSPTTADLRDLWGTSTGEVVFAVGDGVVLRLDGSGWHETAVSASLRAIWGTSASVVFAVGDGGAILRRSGEAWVAMASPTGRTLHAVWGRSAAEVYAAGDGGTLLRLDGGAWREVGVGVTQSDLRGLHGDGKGIVAVGHGAILRHDDKSGWQATSSPGSTMLRGIWGGSASGTTRVVAVGHHGTVLELSDGLEPAAEPRWAEMSPSATEADLAAVWGSAPDNLYAVGEGGAMIRFDGKLWRAVKTPTDEDLRAIWGSAAEDIFAVGGSFNKSNAILRFDGRSWEPMASPFKAALWGVWGSGRNDVYAVGDDGVVLHFDGSAWKQIATLLEAGWLSSVWGSSASRVFTVGTSGEIFRFDGRSWQRMQAPDVPSGLTWVGGFGPERVFAAGDYGTLLVLDGERWRRAAADLRRPAAPTLGMVGWGCETIHGLWGPSEALLFAVGDLGVITRLTHATP